MCQIMVMQMTRVKTKITASGKRVMITHCCCHHSYHCPTVATCCHRSNLCSNHVLIYHTKFNVILQRQSELRSRGKSWRVLCTILRRFLHQGTLSLKVGIMGCSFIVPRLFMLTWRWWWKGGSLSMLQNTLLRHLDSHQNEMHTLFDGGLLLGSISMNSQNHVVAIITKLSHCLKISLSIWNCTHIFTQTSGQSIQKCFRTSWRRRWSLMKQRNIWTIWLTRRCPVDWSSM